MHNNVILAIVVASALAFDITNGFHDTANVVATSISTRRWFRLGQIASGGMLALAHGTNDAQKTMGAITLALVANGNLQKGAGVPKWVVISAAAAIALGTYSGGWRIIKTMGSRIIKMDPAQGFAAQTSGAATVLAASHFGYPLSTTHVINGA